MPNKVWKFLSMSHNENKSRKVFSSDGKAFFRIVESSGRSFSLEKYIICYDDEEEVEYIVRQQPDPTSRYETIEIATNEAKRILE